MMLWSWRAHDEIFKRTPSVRASSPRYAPHGHTAMAISVTQAAVERPISP